MIVSFVSHVRFGNSHLKKKHDFYHTKVLGCPVQLWQILPSHMLAGVEPFYAGVQIQQQNGRVQC